MGSNLSPRVIGAFVIGLGLVGIVYVYVNFGEVRNARTVTSETEALIAQAREPIEVTDRDNNGIEDWKDAILDRQPSLAETTAKTPDTYTMPETLTGKLSIELLQEMISGRIYGPVADATPDDIVEELVDQAMLQTNDRMYYLSDLNVSVDTADAIRNYANLAALIMTKHNVSGSDGELTILNDALQNSDPERLDDLSILIQAYTNMRDDFLTLPVPPALAAEHLDLINVFTAIRNDIEGMQLVFDDSVVALVRIRQYESHAESFGYALQNLAIALERYAPIFNTTDPAILFVIFHPDFSSL